MYNDVGFFLDMAFPDNSLSGCEILADLLE
jgi:hypothetical protein